MLKLIISLLSLIYIINLIPKIFSWFYIINFIYFLIPLTIIFLINPYFTSFPINNYFSIDSIRCILIILTLWITSLIIISRISILLIKSYKLFLTIIIIILLILIITFLTNNLFLFYIFFESSLIPIFRIIIIWGYQPERFQASLYLIIYTLTASLPLLIIIFFLFKINNHLNINLNNWIFFYNSIMPLCWIFIMLAFLVKLPIFIFHLWLPKAHVEAPVAGSIILASVLLKLGSYGIIRISILFQHLNKNISLILIPLSLVGGSIVRIICIRQTDLKSLIAYSSVRHISILLSGTLISYNWSLLGILILIISHGLCSSALFIIVNVLYSSIHTRRIYLIKGILIIIPIFSFWWFILNIINIAAPPSINFIREFILFRTIINKSSLLIIPLIIIRFFTAVYSLYVYSSSQHGNYIAFQNNLISITSISYLTIYLHFFPILIILFKLIIFY